jgi:hypothetical protein
MELKWTGKALSDLGRLYEQERNRSHYQDEKRVRGRIYSGRYNVF